MLQLFTVPVVGVYCLTTVVVTKTKTVGVGHSRRNGDIPGMTSLKDGDLQHSSAFAQPPERDIEPHLSRQKLIRNRTASRLRSDGRSRRYCNTGYTPVSDGDHYRFSPILHFVLWTMVSWSWKLFQLKLVFQLHWRWKCGALYLNGGSSLGDRW